jgi:hypothetical protein
MTTVVGTPTESVELPWDYFLQQLEPKNVANPMLERFRRVEWETMVRNLARYHGQEVAYEPHWVAPGRAVYWHHEIIREKQVDAEGNTYLDDVDHGWRPRGFPQGLATGNEMQLLAMLKKGFRLRPPIDGVDEVFESAVPSEAQGEPQIEAPLYECKRHTKGRMTFISWKSYIDHCRHFKEKPDQVPPQEVIDKMVRATYYCVLCDKSFDAERQAAQHVANEQRKWGSGHPTVAQMLQHKETA